MARAIKKSRLGAIAPERMYPQDVFLTTSGITRTRWREARLQGIECKVLRVGRRVFIRGSDGIEFIEKLAELTAQQKAEAAR